MTDRSLKADDFPLAERRPDLVRGARGRSLPELTLDAVLAGKVGIEDLRITPDALLKQAQLARSAGRDRLAANFERAAEMALLPQDTVMEIYELLRPGRARDAAPLHAWAARLRTEFDAPALAAFVEEAAEVYQARGVFRLRY